MINKFNILVGICNSVDKTILLGLVMVLLLTGCSTWFNHYDVVEWPDGSITKVQVSSDGVVTAKKGDSEVVSDHRGRPSVLELILGVGAASVIGEVKVVESE